MIRALALCTAAVLAASASAAERTITVAGPKSDLTNVPLVVDGANAPAGTVVTLAGPDGKKLLAQSTTGREPKLVFVVPQLKAGQVATFKLTNDDQAASEAFAFTEVKGESIDLKFGKRPVWRYMNAPLDETSKDTRFKTFKVFHHLFDPKGEALVTNGPGGQFPHHRGLFFGFNRIGYAGKTADVWHCNNGESQEHSKVVSTEAGPVFASQRTTIGWHGKDKAVFAEEFRGLTAYNVPGGTMLDFATTLESKLDDVIKLDGDPQHAGFHFRAAASVGDKTAKQTYYLRPDGKGKPDETRNWDAKGKAANAVNLPWNAMSFVLGETRYTVLRINHPSNPTETRGSERNYGRFGDYFEYTLTKEKPLSLKYRVWLQEGEMTLEQCRAMAEAFTSPPKATAAE